MDFCQALESEKALQLINLQFAKIGFFCILFPYVHKAKTKLPFCQVLVFPFGFLLSIFVDFVGLFNWILVE